MKPFKIVLMGFVLALGLWLAGCANGPALRLTVDFKQGPEFGFDFGLTPQVTNAPGVN